MKALAQPRLVRHRPTWPPPQGPVRPALTWISVASLQLPYSRFIIPSLHASSAPRCPAGCRNVPVQRTLTIEIRTIRSKVTFTRPFALRGSDELLPAGDYTLVIEEERLQGLSFDAYRRTGVYLEVVANPRFPGRTELHPVTDADLHQAGVRHPDQTAATNPHTDADNVPRKDTE